MDSDLVRVVLVLCIMDSSGSMLIATTVVSDTASTQEFIFDKKAILTAVLSPFLLDKK